MDANQEPHADCNLEANTRYRPSRRELIIGAGALAFTLGVSRGIEHFANINLLPDPRLNSHAFASEAIVAHAQLQAAFSATELQRRGLFYGEFPNRNDENKYAEAWPHGRAQSATIRICGLTDSADYEMNKLNDTFSALEHYRLPIGDALAFAASVSKKGKIKVFNDDQAWFNLNALSAFKLTQNEERLDLAKSSFAFTAGNWAIGQECASGGVNWQYEHSGRGTVSNSPVAKAGFRLSQITDGSESDWYYHEAIRMFDWVRHNLKDPEDGMFWDSIDDDCSINRKKWSYNQGTMIGNYVLLYQIDGSPEYIKDARNLATTSLNYFTKGDKNDLREQPEEFNVIYFENLFLLMSQIDDEPLKRRIRTVAEDYGQHIWLKFFMHQNRGLLLARSSYVIQQGAIVDMVGLLGWKPEDYDKLI